MYIVRLDMGQLSTEAQLEILKRSAELQYVFI
jgi:hypothetical protein